MVVNPLGRAMDVKLVHEANALDSIVVTELGIETEVN